MNGFLQEVWAVALRDLKKREKFVKYAIGIVIAAAVILLIGYGFDTFIDFSKYGHSYMEFFSAGIIALYIALPGITIGPELILDRKGFMRLLLAAPISRYSILFGKIVSSFILSLRSLFVITLMLLIVFKKFDLLRIIEILAFVLFTVISYHGFGMWLSSFFKSAEFAMKVSGYITAAFILLSGIFYPIQALPKLIQYVFYINPLTYTADFFRFIMIGEHAVPLIIDIAVLSAFGIFSIFFGTYRFDKSLRN